MLNPNSIEAVLQRLANGEELLDVLDKPSTEGLEIDDPILCDRCSEKLPEDFLTVAYVLRSTIDQDVQRICQDCHDRADWVMN